ncbi:DUF1793-domain-containing protein [Polyporus arcularius HHB13444]|uniref:DUF1793-domain-containing protein n=1 Tax=Polyporus arcularius HHB13444 TaxID=1314778 RepID=A0A5C3PJM9_9APHY|nr:DUF1793-domain-containing protein [Polyporus arcularius HHB13444]
MMSFSTLWSLLLVLFSTLVGAQRTFFPASIPLSIRSPYHNVWLISTNTSGSLSQSWPHFWGQQSIMGWSGKIRVDQTTYVWMGQDGIGNGSAVVTDVQITPTRSIFVMQAGPMNLTINFLSPIEPSDWVKQSFPFSYISLEAASLDGASHSVQVYSDISGEWLSGNRSSPISWRNTKTGNSVFHEIELQTPTANVEIANQAQDGKAYYVMASRPGLTWQIDTDTSTRNLFANQGSLANIESSAFGPINNPFFVFAIAVDLGTISSTSDPVTWGAGYVRDPSVRYTTSSGETQNRRPYFVSQYSDIGSAIDAFTADFTAAHDRAVALDQKIMSDASKVSSNYVDLVSLGARQTFGALDITVLADDKGNVDASDVKIFMKDLGTSLRVNAVERLYAAFPTYLYLNASFGGFLLAPLLESQDGLTGQQYAAQDLGTGYPLAILTPGTHSKGIEQSGNMLIMMYAHARVSGDGTLLAQHYNLTKRWADYLVSNTLTFDDQASADGENKPNMTNLALKGIIGVKAMAEISRALGKDSDAQEYDSHASALIGSWLSLAESSSQQHLLGIYGDQQSWALLYNIYADLLLGTKLVPQSIIEGQTQFYGSLLTTAPVFGLPIDSNSGQQSSAAWSLLTAATVSDDGVRNQLIQGVWSRISSNTTGQGAFPDQYNDATGAILSGAPSPAIGAMFSHLALTVPNTTIVVPADATSRGPGSNTTSAEDRTKSNIGPIVGGVVGGVVIIGLAIFGFIFWRRRRNLEDQYSEKVEFVDDEAHRPSLSPYNYPASQDSVPFPYGSAVPLAGRPSGSDAAGQSQYGRSQYTDPGVAGLGTPSIHTPPRSPSESSGYARLAYDDPSPAPVTTIAVSKAREAALNRPQHYHTSSISASSATGSAALTASSTDPLSPNSGSRSGAGSSISPTEVVSLRAEVENLRRVMQEIRADRFEPPPEYQG